MRDREAKVNQIGNYLAYLIGSKIGKAPEEIDKEESFFSLGIDSIVLQEIMSELDKTYDHLPPTLLFEYPNIYQLAGYLQDKQTKGDEIEEIQLFSSDDSQQDDSRDIPSPLFTDEAIPEIKNETTPEVIHEAKPQVIASATSHQRGYDMAVIGMSGRFPKAPDLEAYWQNLLEGRDCIEEIPKDRWELEQFFDPDPSKSNTSYGKWGGFIKDIDKFDPLFFNISPVEAEQMDPQQRLLLECTWETMERAGYGDRNQYKDKAVGVFVGMMWNEYSLLANQSGFSKNTYVGPGSLYWAVANRISYVMDFKGPSIALDTACSSSLVAVHLACQSIMNGDCDMAIAGGVNLSIHPYKYIYLSQAKFLSKDGRCRSFGEGGTGYVPGEGVGAVLLKPLDKAIQDGDHIYGVIRGSSTNHGGKATGFTVPNPDAQAQLIMKAFERAHISPEQLGYIECHGTGTSLGDPIEITGLTRAFQAYTQKKQFCPIGSVKSNVGHLEAAAGVAALIKVLLCMEHNRIPKSLHSEIKNPNIDFNETPFFVVNETREWVSSPSRPKVAGISSFGAGGSNAHLIIESYEGERADIRNHYPNPEEQDAHLIVLSGKNEDRLKAYAGRLDDFLRKAIITSGTEQAPHPALPEIAYTLQVGREAREERIALIVSGIEELSEKLALYIQGKKDIKNFYAGNIRATRGGIGSLLEGEEGREFLRTVIKKRNLTKLAQLWLAGVPIDWELLYAPAIPRRIPLPTYPFARGRYWIPEGAGVNEELRDDRKNGQGGVKDVSAQLHPLIDQNTSTLEKQRFSTLLTGHEFYLADHVVNNHKLLPGVAYLEMARAAGEIASGKKVQKLKDIIWARPITMEKTPQMMHISLHPHHQTGFIEYEVATNGGENQRVSHSLGKIIYGDQIDSQTARIDIDGVTKRCTAVKESTECYRLFQSKGFSYGPSFQAIQKLWINGTEAISSLTLPAKSKTGFHDFALHPSMMDGALQAVIALLDNMDADGLYLPLAMGEVELVRPLEERCYAYVTLAGDQKTTGLKKFNIYLTDQAGHVLVRMKDFSMKAFKSQSIPENRATRPESSKMISFTPIWEKSGAIPVLHPHEQAGCIIVFDTQEDVYNLLPAKLSPGGESRAQVILVKPGEEFRDSGNNRYEINPGRKEDYLKLMETLKGLNITPGLIIHLWSKEEFSSSTETLPSLLAKGVYSLLYLNQALMEQKLKNKITILYAYVSSPDHPQPQYAALSGFAKTICRENPRFAYKIIEIQALSHELDILVGEMKPEADDVVEIRYAGGQRWVKRLQEFDFDSEPAKGEARDRSVTLRERGVYVITGGAGGLGLILAEYLAKKTRARLVLSGRSDLTPEKEAHLKRLEALGAAVVYIKADVSKREDVTRLIAETKARFKEIHGIIHSAGLIRDSLAVRKTTGEMDSVLAPKVYGTVFLDEAMRNEKLDFLVFFSSITAVMGNTGQCDYAYGNSFMDNFAAWREDWRKVGARSGKTLSINWPLWEEGGMQVDEQTKQFLARTTGMEALSKEAGLAAFTRGLTLAESQFVVAQGNHQKLRKYLGVREQDHNQDKSRQTARPEQYTQPNPASESGEKAGHGREDNLLPSIQRDITLIVSDIMHVHEQDIYPDEDMSSYGFDSVSFTEFATRVNEKFELEITPAVFFEYSSIGSLTDYLGQEYQDIFIRFYHDALKVHSPIIQEAENPMVQEVPAESAIEREAGAIRFHRFDEETIQGNEDVIKEAMKPRKETGPAPVAIIGMSGVMPQSEDLESFWKHMEEGRDLITEVPRDRWDWEKYYGDPSSEVNKTRVKWGGFMKEVDTFDALFFGISPREAELMDPQQRIFLETVWKAIEDAGYKPSDFSGTKTGVFVGAATSDYYELLTKNSIQIEAHTSTGRFHSITANRISYLLNLHGPSEPIDTACSSSLVAIHRAVQAIRNGNCDLAIAGGVNVILTPSLHISFSKAGMLCEDGRCKTFDKRANGYVRGEGAGAILLKPLSQAEADGDHIYAVIRATAENHGGHANSLTAPNPSAQADLLVSAYEEANIDPSTVSYIETHGTGTSLGDPIEINGLKKAFGELYKKWGKSIPTVPHCGLGTVKTNIGHLETAAGIAGILKVLLAMKYKKLPATVHFTELNPYIRIEGSPFYVVKETRPWESLPDDYDQIIPRRAGVSSFGFGGANAHVILEEYIKASPQEYSGNQVPCIVPLSAKDEERLKSYAIRMAEFIQREREKGGSKISLADIAYTLQTGREAMEKRLAMVVSDMDELTEKLARYGHGDPDTEHVYTGEIQKGKAGRDMLVEEDADELIRIMIKNQRFTKLAQLWVSGLEMDWRLLYQTSTPNRISLPTYPFARERYWIPKQDQEHEPGGHDRQGSHPLIDRIIPSLSLREGLVFQKILRDTDLIVQGHKVKEQSILPGVGYLEMIRAAISQVRTDSPFHLSEMVWLRPLAVKEGKKEIRIMMRENDRDLQYEFHSTDNGDSLLQARGTARFHESDARKDDQWISIEEIKARCTQQIDRESIYSRFKKAGMNYGPYFQGLEHIWLHEHEALGHLMIPAAYEHELKKYILHPTLMDSALQTISGFYEKTSPTLLPFTIEEVEILHPLKPRVYAYVQALGEHRFHVAIIDEAGLLLIKLHDVAMRELKDDLQNFFYYPQWTESFPTPGREDKNVSATKDTTGKRTVLIIHPRQSFGLEKVLAESYPMDDVIDLELGSETRQHTHHSWTMNTEDPMALDSCIRQLTDLDHVYFLGGIQDQKDDADDLDTVNHTQEQGVLSLFRLVKSLSRNDLIQHPLQLKVITNDAQQIASEPVANFHAGSLSGFTRVMASEYQMIEASCIDISLKEIQSSTEKLRAVARAILTEPGDPKGREVVIRDGKRYVRTLVPIHLPPVDHTLFRPGGVYVILGGAGGIGLALSRYLAEKFQAHLVLLGRSELDDRRREKISQIESKGGKVLYLKADATNLASMRAAIEKARSQFGKINGVIHSALVLKDRLLENMDEESFRKALDPKVTGSIALYKAVEGEALDFILFFSSAVSFFGNRGQSNYTAGCTFKDAFALSLNHKAAYPVKTINWGFWGSIGIAAKEELSKRLKAIGAQSIESEEGMEAVKRILSHPVDQIMAIKAEEHFLERLGVDLHHQLTIDENTRELKLIEHERIFVQPSSNLQEHPLPKREVKQASGREGGLRHYIQERILENIGTSLGMDTAKIDYGKPFSEYGVDSIIGMELIGKLNKVFRIELKAATIFNYANVNDLSRYVYDKYGEVIKVEPEAKSEQTSMPLRGTTKHENRKLFSKQTPMPLQGTTNYENRKLFSKQTIFITGPTGILGGYILKELLETTDSQIYCLIRANDTAHARERIKTILASYGTDHLVSSSLNQRILPVIGDITKEYLGLHQKEYQQLVDSIDCTIHLAASTNLIMPYKFLAPINVQGVKNIIDFVLQTKQKYLMHVSSYHVMADVIYRSNFAFTEQHFDVGQGFSKMGYQETKFEGERLVRQATPKGLVWNIFRPGNIFGERKSGLYPLEMSGSASIFHRLFEMIIKSGVAAFGHNYFDITPVDYIAEGILFLGLKRDSFLETYHMLNNDKKKWYEIINLVNEYGYKVKLLPVDDYLAMVHQGTLPLNEEVAPEWLNLMKYGFASKEFFMNDGHAEAGYTQSLLEEQGIICPKIDTKLLGTYLSYYASKGIIHQIPSHHNQPGASPTRALVNKQPDPSQNSTLRKVIPKGKEAAMKSNAYEFIIVGSGAGGATIARELAKGGKKVLVVEQGRRERKVGGLMNSLRHFDHHKVTMWPKASKEGTYLYRAIMAGGSTMVSCGNGTRCSEDELAAFGINLNVEFAEAEKEMGIAPFNLRWLSKGSRKILESCKELGYKMEPMPKFMRYNKCRRCGTCFMGCQYGAKWTSLDYLDEAIENGAATRYETTIDHVLVENGKAVGVKGKGPEGQVEIFGHTVILAAGGLATPAILQRTGLETAGSNLFGDLLVNVYGVTQDLSQLGEPSMALVDTEFHKSKGFILSTWPQPSRMYRFVEAGLRGMLLPPNRTLGIMIKSADDPTGQVYADGSFSKIATENDRARLEEGAEIARGILIKAGADSKSLVVGKPFGAHPGGTAAIGKVVNQDLQTEISNLFVCDASVFPSSLGAPPILTIAALAKRLARKLVSQADLLQQRDAA